MTDEFTVEEIFADRLEEMLKLQEELQRRYHKGLSPRRFSDDFRVEYINLMILATTDELHEALREMPWKPWSKSQEVTHEAVDRFKDELVDAFHFFMNMMLVVDMSADEFFQRYLRKNGVNHGRIDDGYASPTG